MFKCNLKILLLAGILLSPLNQKTFADYDYSVEEILPDSFPGSTSSNFSITKDSSTCSSGGGSIPSLWVGAQSGNGDTQGGDLTNNESNDFVNGGIGFVIPLGKKLTTDCQNLLAILEFQEFLSTIDILNEMGIVDQSKVSTVIQNYIKKVSRELGVDLNSAINTDLNLVKTSPESSVTSSGDNPSVESSP